MGGLQVLQFTGGGNTFNIYNPMTPDPLNPNRNFSAGAMVFANAGVFAALRDEMLFRQVRLELGAVTWPGELDLAPDAMYAAIKQTGKWVLI